MKTLQQWFDEYAISHQNKTNKKIHYICVPVIYFSVVGLLMAVKIPFEINFAPFLNHFSFWFLLLVIYFYFRISVEMAIKMLFFSTFCFLFNYYLSTRIALTLFSISIFIIAWVGQFYGHKIEGKKPSFLKDLQFLLIGPAWVIENFLKKSNSDL